MRARPRDLIGTTTSPEVGFTRPIRDTYHTAKDYWLRWRYRDDSALDLSVAGHNIVADTTTSIAKQFYYPRYADDDATHEPAVAERFVAAIEEGDIVYDLGSHVGYYSLLAASAGAEVHAVDVDPDALTAVERSARRTGVADRITTHYAAVVDSTGEHVTVGPTGETIFVAWGEDRASYSLVGDGCDAETTTIDALPDTPDVVKADIEGAEQRALEGAERTLGEQRPTWLIALHPRQLGNTVDAVESELKQAGYELEAIDERRTDAPWTLAAIPRNQSVARMPKISV